MWRLCWHLRLRFWTTQKTSQYSGRANNNVNLDRGKIYKKNKPLKGGFWGIINQLAYFWYLERCRKKLNYKNSEGNKVIKAAIAPIYQEQIMSVQSYFLHFILFFFSDNRELIRYFVLSEVTDTIPHDIIRNKLWLNQLTKSMQVRCPTGWKAHLNNHYWWSNWEMLQESCPEKVSHSFREHLLLALTYILFLQWFPSILAR